MDKKKIVIIIVSLLAIIGIIVPAVSLMNKSEKKNDMVEITSEELEVSNDVLDENVQDKDNAGKEMNEKKDDKKDTAKVEKQTAVVKEEEKKTDPTIQTESKNGSKDKKEGNNEASKPSETIEKQPAAEEPKTTEAAIQQPTAEVPKPVNTEAEKPSTTERPNTTTEVTTEKEKVWHEAVYENVWVIDEPAWNEDIVEYHAICNQCGFDLTSSGVSWDAHCKASADEEGYEHCFSYSCGVPVVVNTIHHKEEGHYEKKLVKDGYWE